MAHHENGAAVGLMVNGGRILFIKRKERDGDPWSGHIALPGGFIKDGENPWKAALREIEEETALRVHQGEIVAELPVLHPVSRHEVSVHPFLISPDTLDGAVPGEEVSEIRTVNLAELDYRRRYFHGHDAYLAGDWIIWGLTYRILSTYFDLYPQGKC